MAALADGAGDRAGRPAQIGRGGERPLRRHRRPADEGARADRRGGAFRRYLRPGRAARGGGRSPAGLHPDGDHFQSRCCAWRDRPDRGDRARGGRGAGGGQHLRHAPDRAAARTGRPLQRPQPDQVSGRPRRRAGRRGGHRCRQHFDSLRALSRTIGPVLGPFESYLTMRGIKTFPLRMERQCANACRVAHWLAAHPRVERVYFTGDPAHPGRRRHPPALPAESLRRHGELRNQGRRPGRRSSASWTRSG